MELNIASLVPGTKTLSWIKTGSGKLQNVCFKGTVSVIPSNPPCKDDNSSLKS